MRNLDPQIPIQIDLHKQLYNAMQGDIIGAIMRKYNGDNADRFIHCKMKGNSLQVLPNILPTLSALCEGVKEKLEFNESVDFYVTGSPEVNACAILSRDENKPHIIEINSALFNLMSDDELKYIIGHEIGHLINRDGELMELYHYIYPNPDDEECVIPKFLESRYGLWGRIAELSADRYGYLACENMEACVTAIFKMSSGLSLDQMNIRIGDLIELNNRSLEYYLSEHITVGGSHPVNPARIQALHLFAKAKTQKALVEGMGKIMEIVEGFYYSDIEDAIAHFFGCAGLYMYTDKGKIGRQEEEFIINRMADYSRYPSKLYKKLIKCDYIDIMHKALGFVSENDPHRVGEMINFLIDLAFVDNRIEPAELNKIFEVATSIEIDCSVIISVLTDKIRDDFNPLASLMV